MIDALTRPNALIAKLSTFATLSTGDQALLADLARDTRRVPARRLIIAEGDKPRRVHLVLEGWAARFRVVRGGARQITAILLPGDFCDLHVTVLEEMDHGMIALSDTIVAYINPEQINLVTERSHAITRAFWWLTLLDEAVLRAWLVNVGRRNARERIANLFCELHVRASRIGMVKGNSFHVPLTQEELGDAMGLTPVHVNRMIRELRAEGLISLKAGEATIPDVARLRAFADFSANYLHTPATMKRSIDGRDA